MNRIPKSQLQRVTFQGSEFLYIPSETPNDDAEYGAEPALLVPEHLVTEEGGPTPAAKLALVMGVFGQIGGRFTVNDAVYDQVGGEPLGQRSEIVFQPVKVAA